MMKEFWDSATYGFSGAYFSAQLFANVDAIVNIILGCCLIVLAVVRIFYWIKNDGYVEKEA